MKIELSEEDVNFWAWGSGISKSRIERLSKACEKAFVTPTKVSSIGEGAHPYRGLGIYNKAEQVESYDIGGNCIFLAFVTLRENVTGVIFRRIPEVDRGTGFLTEDGSVRSERYPQLRYENGIVICLPGEESEKDGFIPQIFGDHFDEAVEKLHEYTKTLSRYKEEK